MRGMPVATRVHRRGSGGARWGVQPLCAALSPPSIHSQRRAQGVHAVEALTLIDHSGEVRAACNGLGSQSRALHVVVCDQVGISFLQVVSVTNSVLRIPWPTAVNSLLDVAKLSLVRAPARTSLPVCLLCSVAPTACVYQCCWGARTLPLYLHQSWPT